MPDEKKKGQQTPDAAATAGTPKTQKERTPEQQATAKRAQAKALRQAAFGVPAPSDKPLLDRAAQLEAEAETLHPKPTKERKPKKEHQPQPPCPAKKKDGTQCTARCAAGKETCVDHQPAWDRLTENEREWWTDAMDNDKQGLEDIAKWVVDLIGWHGAKKQVAAETLR